MKVTARDIAALVRDTQVEMMRKRSAEPKESLIDALILDEMQKMTSLVDGEAAPRRQRRRGLDEPRSERVRRHLELGRRARAGPQQPGARPGRRAGTAARRAASMASPTGTGEIESLEQMLEPDRTGVHGNGDGKKPSWIVIVVIMVVLAGGAASRSSSRCATDVRGAADRG